jgi:hypothetical protein
VERALLRPLLALLALRIALADELEGVRATKPVARRNQLSFEDSVCTDAEGRNREGADVDCDWASSMCRPPGVGESESDVKTWRDDDGDSLMNESFTEPLGLGPSDRRVRSIQSSIEDGGRDATDGSGDLCIEG